MSDADDPFILLPPSMWLKFIRQPEASREAGLAEIKELRRPDPAFKWRGMDLCEWPAGDGRRREELACLLSGNSELEAGQETRDIEDEIFAIASVFLELARAEATSDRHSAVVVALEEIQHTIRHLKSGLQSLHPTVSMLFLAALAAKPSRWTYISDPAGFLSDAFPTEAKREARAAIKPKEDRTGPTALDELESAVTTVLSKAKQTGGAGNKGNFERRVNGDPRAFLIDECIRLMELHQPKEKITANPDGRLTRYVRLLVAYALGEEADSNDSFLGDTVRAAVEARKKHTVKGHLARLSTPSRRAAPANPYKLVAEALQFFVEVPGDEVPVAASNRLLDDGTQHDQETDGPIGDK
jgi:hypothetical protein